MQSTIRMRRWQRCNLPRTVFIFAEIFKPGPRNLKSKVFSTIIIADGPIKLSVSGFRKFRGLYEDGQVSITPSPRVIFASSPLTVRKESGQHCADIRTVAFVPLWRFEHGRRIIMQARHSSIVLPVVRPCPLLTRFESKMALPITCLWTI
jgi:hypothetical protein